MDANLAHTLADVLSFILGFVKLIVIASIIASWIGDPSNQIVQAINGMSEPIYRPFRKFTNQLPGPLDWAPIAVFLAIIVIEGLVVRPLAQYTSSPSERPGFHIGN